MQFDSPTKAMPVFIGNDSSSPIPIEITTGGGPFGPPESTPLPAPSALDENYLSQITEATTLINPTAGPKVVQYAIAPGTEPGPDSVVTVSLPAPATQGNLLVLIGTGFLIGPAPAGWTVVASNGLGSPGYLVCYLVAQGGEQTVTLTLVNALQDQILSLFEMSEAGVLEAGDIYNLPWAGSTEASGVTPVAFCLPIGVGFGYNFSGLEPVVLEAYSDSDAWQQQSVSMVVTPGQYVTATAGYSLASPAAGTERGVQVAGASGYPTLVFVRPPPVLPVGYTRVWELGMQAAAADIAQVVRSDNGQVLGTSFGGFPRVIDYQPTGLIIPNSAKLTASTSAGDAADFWATFDSI
jgi:hypothetical protein